MAELYNLIRDGYTDAEILEINKDWLFHLNKIREARSIILSGESAKKKITKLIAVSYISIIMVMSNKQLILSSKFIRTI